MLPERQRRRHCSLTDLHLPRQKVIAPPGIARDCEAQYLSDFNSSTRGLSDECARRRGDSMITRRDVTIALLGVYALAGPLSAQTQTAKPARVAVLGTSSPEMGGFLVDAFMRRLRELGYVEGKDVAFETRWARGHLERLPELVQELLALNPTSSSRQAGTAPSRFDRRRRRLRSSSGVLTILWPLASLKASRGPAAMPPRVEPRQRHEPQAGRISAGCCAGLVSLLRADEVIQ
jgi:hypothetical protein